MDSRAVRSAPTDLRPSHAFFPEMAPPQKSWPFSFTHERACNGHLYFIEGPLAVDFIGRFEELHQDFAKITDRLGLDIRLGTSDRAVRRKTDPDFDPATPSYRKHYDEELREVVRRRYQREIEHFGYEF